MNLKTLLITAIVLPVALFVPQKSISQTTFYHRYVVAFIDKNNSPYSLSDPSAYLSQRAIDRRNRYGIPIVENDLPVNPGYVSQVAATGVKILNKSKWLNSITIQTDDSLALVAINNLPFVQSTNPIAAIHTKPSLIQKEKWTEDQAARTTYAPADYSTAYNQIHMMHGESLHAHGFRGEGMVIAVLDGGFYNAKDSLDIFDSLFNEGRVLGTHDFVHGSDFVYGMSTHGTEVLSCIAANKPGFEIGTAPEASFYLFVTEDVTSESPIEEHNWAAGAEMADSVGADVITSSLGYSDFDDPAFNHTYEDMNGHTAMSSIAATIAASKGIVVCSSAGNEGDHPWFYITAPADADSILTVGATDATATFTAFSSHGPSSDGRIKPDVVAQGIGAWVIDPLPSNHTTYPGNGTSFSNPITAGLVACLRQAHPDKNSIEIIEAIQRSASLFNNPNDSFGYGVPNFELANALLSGKEPDDSTTGPFIYPNPFNSYLGILYFENAGEQIQVRVHDAMGRLITAFHTTLQPASNGYSFVPTDFFNQAANGLYMVTVQFSDHHDVFRVVKADPD